jgi:predicted nucleic acid-binding protein
LKRAVIDASVVLKWYLADEQYSEKAMGLLEKYVSDRLEILAPSLLDYEVVNGLVIASRRGRIEEGQLLTAVDGFVDLGIKLKNLSMFSPQVLHYCKVYNRSIYDASYLALAEDEGIPLITSDQGVYNAVRKDIQWVKWLGDI